jgi:hypothetical protein
VDQVIHCTTFLRAGFVCQRGGCSRCPLLWPA